ncbi:hypothetical protein [Yoonia sp. SS1-5]|uniref:Uncharacterized protein n=1 Tax=Yoonia rhodophyticola TaxID=3137370 RepID=A0AAN0M6Y2_9RHOB
MKRLALLIAAAALLGACTPARMVGAAAVTTGKVVVGAADVVL